MPSLDWSLIEGSRSLGKDERLSKTLLLDKLFHEGKAVSQNGFTLVYLFTALPTFYPAQAAFSAPKRNFKHAVDRNRVKRLLREAYRLHKLPLYRRLTDSHRQMALMLIYKGAVIPDYETTRQNMLNLIDRLIQKIPAVPK